MANDAWEEVLKAVSAGDAAAGAVQAGQHLVELTTQLQSAVQGPDVRSSSIGSVIETAMSGALSSAAPASSGSGVAGTILGFLGAGMGISPLVKSLMSLFGGGGDDPSTASVLPTYLAPASVQFEGLYNSDSRTVTEASAGQGGQIRQAASQAAAAAPQITVNVQAMDSQSFLDRSDDIARAVRQSMLQSSILNDVVREL